MSFLWAACREPVGDPIELRPWKPQQELPPGGFGLLKSQRPPVPVDFDPCLQVEPPRPGAGGGRAVLRPRFR